MNGIRRLARMRPSRFAIASTLAVSLTLSHSPAARAAGESVRSLSGGSYALELGGTAVGMLRSASGGDAQTTPVGTPAGGLFVNKHPGQVQYSDLVLEIVPGMEAPLFDWIAASWEGKGTRQSGAVLVADYNFQVLSRKEFHDALVTETALPALDASSKEAASLTVRLAPETVRFSKGGGAIPSTLATKQRPWMASNFRLEIPGLDCTRVRRIEPFRMTRKTARDEVGQERQGGLIPGAITFSDLVVTLPEASSESWRQWLQTFLVDGRSDDSQEKTGDLVLLGNDMQSEIARIHLAGLGIAAASYPNGDVGGSAIRNVTFTLYCERASLEWKGGAGAVMNVRVFGR